MLHTTPHLLPANDAPIAPLVPGPLHPDALLSRRELAQVLRLSPRTLERMFLEGGGPPAIRVSSRRVVYRVGDVRGWLETRRTASTSEATARGLAA